MGPKTHFRIFKKAFPLAPGGERPNMTALFKNPNILNFIKLFLNFYFLLAKFYSLKDS